MDYLILRFPEIDSTNAEARRMIEAGDGGRAALVADTQTRGRGRRDSKWQSPVGNIYCTIMEPLAGELRHVGLQAYIYGLAIARAANGLLPTASARVKWPNDVLVNDHKVAGVLLETAYCPKTEKTYLIAGVGVNVAVVPEAMPGTAFPPSSLVAQGATCTAETMLQDVLKELALLQEMYARSGFAAIRSLWCEMAYGLGQPITVTLPDHTRLHGVFADLDADGALILDAAGSRQAITAGEVFFPPAAVVRHG